MVSTQNIVEISTIIIFVLTFILAIYLTKNYLKKRARNLLFWSTGLWLFALGVLLEIVFAFGVYSEFLIAAYLLTVAMLVNFLALGSMELIKSVKLRMIYYGFSVVTIAVLVYTLITNNIGYILFDFVVWSNIPLYVILASSVITFVAAAILVTVAALSYLKTKNIKMISIILGVIVVSIAGTLYIIQFPVLLYYSEFIGILLLWLGFFDFSILKRAKARSTR